MGTFRISVSILLLIVIVTTSVAQADYPLNNLESITPDTAAQFSELARIDGTLQGQLAWSGDLLAVGTTTGAHVFDMTQPDAAPIDIDGDVNVAVDETGDILISDGQRWNIETGESLGVIESNTDSVFSPSGSIEVTTQLENDYIIVQLQNVTTQETITLATTMQEGYRSIVFSPDEQFAALLFDPVAPDYYAVSVQLWNVVEGTFIANLPQQLEIFDAVTFHADGQLLVISTITDAVYGDIFADVQIYDGRTGEHYELDYFSYPPVTYSFDDALMTVPTVRGIQLWSDQKIGLLACGDNNPMEYAGNPLFSPTDYTIAAYEYNSLGAIWYLDSTGTPTQPCLILETESGITDISFNSDGTLLAGSTNDKMVYLWDATTGDERFRLNIGGDYSFNMRFHPTENKLLIEHFGGGYQVWDATTGEILLTAPRGSILNAAWTRAAYWDGGIVRVIDSTSETPFTVIPNYLGRTSALNTTLQWITFVGAEVSIYDLQTGDQVFSSPIDSRRIQVFFSADDTRMAIRANPNISGGRELMTIQIWDTAHLETPINTLELPNTGDDFIFSPDGRFLANKLEAYGESPGGSEIIWDTETAERLVSWENGDHDRNSHAFSPDGSLMATGVADRSIALWDVAATLEQPFLRENSTYVDGVMYAELRLPNTFVSEVEQIVFNDEGDWIAAQVFDRQHSESSIPSSTNVYVWSLTEVHDQGGVIEDGYVEITNATSPIFSSSGNLLMTKDADTNTLRLWEMATGSELHTFPEATLSAFTPDESVLVAYGANTLTLWDVSTLNTDNATPLLTLNDLPDEVQEITLNDAGTLLFVRYTSGVNIYGIAS